MLYTEFGKVLAEDGAGGGAGDVAGDGAGNGASDGARLSTLKVIPRIGAGDGRYQGDGRDQGDKKLLGNGTSDGRTTTLFGLLIEVAGDTALVPNGIPSSGLML